MVSQFFVSIGSGNGLVSDGASTNVDLKAVWYYMYKVYLGSIVSHLDSRNFFIWSFRPVGIVVAKPVRRAVGATWHGTVVRSVNTRTGKITTTSVANRQRYVKSKQRATPTVERQLQRSHNQAQRQLQQQLLLSIHEPLLPRPQCPPPPQQIVLWILPQPRDLGHGRALLRKPSPHNRYICYFILYLIKDTDLGLFWVS